MAITLVDINELASTISKDKDMLFVVEVPSGGGYIQRKVTKEVMFQLLGQNLDMTTTTDGGGVNDVITFDGASGNKVVYINNGSTGVMIFKVGSLGVSADGATNIIQMGRDGTLRIGTGATNGTLQMRDSGQFYEYSGKDLKQNVVVDLDIQNAATTEAVECRNSIAYLEVDAGGTIASHTIQFPATAKVGYTFEFYVKGTITALTLEGGAATVDGTLTTVTNGGGKWVRVVTGGGIGVASWRRVSAEAAGGVLKYHGRLTADISNPTMWVLEQISNSTGSSIQLDENDLAESTIVNDKGLVAKQVNLSMGSTGIGRGGYATYYVSNDELRLMFFKLSATFTLEANDSQDFQISVEIYY